MKTLKALNFVCRMKQVLNTGFSVKYELAFFVFSFILLIFFRACFHQDVHVTQSSSPFRQLKGRVMQYLSLI